MIRIPAVKRFPDENVFHAAHRILSEAARVGLEEGVVLLRGVGTLRYLLILGEDSAWRVPICAVAA